MDDSFDAQTPPATTAEFDALLAQYDYPLEKDWIADQPSKYRDTSRLLVYDRRDDEVQLRRFYQVAECIPEGALVIFNNTKVIPARIRGTVRTGGGVEILGTTFDEKEKVFQGLANRTMFVDDEVRISDRVTLTVTEKNGKIYTFVVEGWPSPLHYLFTYHGTTPIPPYLKHTPLSEDDLRDKYQSLFAKHAGSIAAPTASLHFTRRIFEGMKKRKIETAYVTLHVGLGTFAPLTEDAVRNEMLHPEAYSVPRETVEAIARAKRELRPIFAVGTTAARAVESAASAIPLYGDVAALVPETGISGTTTLFIRPGYRFKIISGMVTNFHVPRSSLLMIVAALVGAQRPHDPDFGRRKLLELYDIAHQKNFRFLSFGDGMLIR